MRSGGFALLAVVTAFALTACGETARTQSSPATTATSKATTTRAMFLSEARRICTAASRRANAIITRANRAQISAEAGALLAPEVPIERRYVEQMRALEALPEDRRVWRSIVKIAGRLVVLRATLVDALKNDQIDLVDSTVATMKTLRDQRIALGKALGACAK